MANTSTRVLHGPNFQDPLPASIPTISSPIQHFQSTQDWWLNPRLVWCRDPLSVLQSCRYNKPWLALRIHLRVWSSIEETQCYFLKDQTCPQWMKLPAATLTPFNSRPITSCHGGLFQTQVVLLRGEPRAKSWNNEIWQDCRHHQSAK